MITHEQLRNNLDKLRKQIPQKPEVYTSDHPLTIKEALTIYSNRRTVHSVQACTKALDDAYWPLPLWFDPHNVRVGFWNRLYYWRYRQRSNGKLRGFDFLWVPVINSIVFKLPTDEVLTEAFEANLGYITNRLCENHLLVSKKVILSEVFKTYKRRYWVACISTLFPLLDYVTRKLFNTKRLGVDISRICKLFQQNGFSLDTVDYLMPHITLVRALSSNEPYSKEQRDSLYEKIKENEFGLIGSALSSFLRFANHYYGYFKEDHDAAEIINRHAILHGSMNEFGTQANCIRLITFLYLFLELEPVFEILFETADS